MTRIDDAYFGGREIMKAYWGDRLIWERRPPVLHGTLASTVSRGQTQLEVYPKDYRQDKEWVALAEGATLRIENETIPIKSAHLDRYGSIIVTLKRGFATSHEAFTPVEVQP
ncbi:hypothetical protein [Trueperella pyogenes]|uniref:hypothetical protein n=1 Tax=Trueperella pyogenes TaxID=1661 RepID=UPI00324E705E